MNVTVLSITIDKTTVLRAAAFKDGLGQTNIDTQTYIFLADVVTQSPNGEAPGNFPVGPVAGQLGDPEEGVGVGDGVGVGYGVGVGAGDGYGLGLGVGVGPGDGDGDGVGPSAG